MISICCTLPKPDFKDLLPEQHKRFGFLVSRYRKFGYPLPEAQKRAYAQVLVELIPFEDAVL
jgi:hypothetical protein